MTITTSPAEPSGLAAALADFNPGDEPIPTKLRTSERVLARVTDGIYRQPGSALRELISNAYDADASRVIIDTDRPRFDRITISDNGRGMSTDVLAHVLHNIGGSAKRTQLGSELDVTDTNDLTRSPGGRKLIGKIGIGLFSVAQLTQTFQITTKVAGDPFSSVASVLLNQYSDTTTEVDDDGRYQAGEVLVWKEPALDRESQGTTITLTSVRNQTRETLQSQETWQKIAAALDGNGRAVQPPTYHIGKPTQTLSDTYQTRPDLPWTFDLNPSAAFEAFADSPFEANRLKRVRSPRYEEIFDDYLAMLWRLGLSAPLPYVGTHPFDLTGSAKISFFKVNGRAREEAVAIQLQDDESLRDVLDFEAPRQAEGFSIQVDDVQLKRPIDLGRKQLVTNSALQRPILAVGHHRAEFKKSSAKFSGGPLEFSAYLFWTPKLCPADHSGVLIRVNEASGTLFYSDFLGFPVNEQRRLPQISAEIFIHEGFDGALNIDRESFNMTHPHVVTLTRWFHNSLRQLINMQKRLGTRAASSKSQANQHRMRERIQAIVDAVWDLQQEGAEPPPVVLLDDMEVSSELDADVIRLPQAVIGDVRGPGAVKRGRDREEVVIAMTQILAAYDVVDELEDEEFVRLVSSLFELILEDVK